MFVHVTCIEQTQQAVNLYREKFIKIIYLIVLIIIVTHKFLNVDYFVSAYVRKPNGKYYIPALYYTCLLYTSPSPRD